VIRIERDPGRRFHEPGQLDGRMGPAYTAVALAAVVGTPGELSKPAGVVMDRGIWSGLDGGCPGGGDRRCPMIASDLIEDCLGAIAANDTVGHRVGVQFVRVADLANAAFELDAAALLDDVRRLVRRGVEAGRSGEPDRVAGSEGGRAIRRAASPAAPPVCVRIPEMS
jgi:hypothetical protein